jgi:hypothetical protein
MDMDSIDISILQTLSEALKNKSANYKTILDTIVQLIQTLPRNVKKQLLRHIISDNSLFNEALSLYYFDGNLLARRYDIDSCTATLQLAKSRFPNGNYYLLTDYVNSDIILPDVMKIKDPSEIKASSKPNVFICIFESDQALALLLKQIMNLHNSYFLTPQKYYPTARYFHRNDLAKTILTKEQKIQMGKFEVADFENIIQAIDITEDVPGHYVEIGVYQGRSAHLALHYMKEKSILRTAYFIDTFAGFSFESARLSKDALWFDTHKETTYQNVVQFLSEFDNVNILQLNIIEDNLPSEISSIAICNLDVDMYESTLNGLIKVSPLINNGGIIILEDQGHTPALIGAYLAVRDFLESDIGNKFIPIHLASGQMYLLRKYV